MVILGLNFHFHDSTACIVKDGVLVAAIEEERLSRNKHTAEFPYQAIQRCMKIASLSAEQIDHIAISANFSKHNVKKIIYALKSPMQIATFCKQEFLRPFYRAKKFKHWYQHTFSKNAPKVHHVEHHLAHIAGSFYVSPYKEAALLSLDGSGEWSTAWTGFGKGNKIERHSETFFPHSLGSFYEAVTEFCGFRPNYDEGKTMGLAPFGDPSVFYDKVRKIISIDSSNRLQIDLSYFSFQNAGVKRCNEKFYQTFGQPRKADKTSAFEKYHYDTGSEETREFLNILKCLVKLT